MKVLPKAGKVLIQLFASEHTKLAEVEGIVLTIATLAHRAAPAAKKALEAIRELREALKDEPETAAAK